MLTIDQLSRINIKLQLFSNKKTGLHTGKMTTDKAIQVCRDIIAIADEVQNEQYT